MLIIIIVILLAKPIIRFVRFGSNAVKEFNPSDPPITCNPLLRNKRAKIEWMRMHAPNLCRQQSNKNMPDYHLMNGYSNETPEPTLEDEISGRVPLKHKPFRSAFQMDIVASGRKNESPDTQSTEPSHEAFEGYGN